MFYTIFFLELLFLFRTWHGICLLIFSQNERFYACLGFRLFVFNLTFKIANWPTGRFFFLVFNWKLVIGNWLFLSYGMVLIMMGIISLVKPVSLFIASCSFSTIRVDSLIIAPPDDFPLS